MAPPFLVPYYTDVWRVFVLSTPGMEPCGRSGNKIQHLWKAHCCKKTSGFVQATCAERLNSMCFLISITLYMYTIPLRTGSMYDIS